MKEKKQSALSRLMDIAGNHKYLSYLSCVLAAVSAWIALIPFYDVFCIIKEILEIRPDFDRAVHLTAGRRLDLPCCPWCFILRH